MLPTGLGSGSTETYDKGTLGRVQCIEIGHQMNSGHVWKLLPTRQQL